MLPESSVAYRSFSVVEMRKPAAV